MNKDLATEIVAFGVRLVADKTTLVRKPDTFETVIDAFTGADTYDVRIAKQIVAETARAAGFVARIATDRKFKKITQNA